MADTLLPIHRTSVSTQTSIFEQQVDYLDRRITQMEANMIDPIQFGGLQAEVAAQRRDLDKIAASIETLSTEMRAVRETLTEAKGGWRAVMLVVGITASVSGGIVYLLQHVKIVP